MRILSFNIDYRRIRKSLLHSLGNTLMARKLPSHDLHSANRLFSKFTKPTLAFRPSRSFPVHIALCQHSSCQPPVSIIFCPHFFHQDHALTRFPSDQLPLSIKIHLCLFLLVEILLSRFPLEQIFLRTLSRPSRNCLSRKCIYPGFPRLPSSQFSLLSGSTLPRFPLVEVLVSPDNPSS